MLASRLREVTEYEKARADLGDFIRRLRVHRGYSQLALARALGLETPQFVSNFERGVALVPVHHVYKMAQELEVDIEVFADKLAKIEYWRVIEGVTGGF